MKIKSIKKVKLDSPTKFYDITVEKYHNFAIGNSNIITHNTSLGKAISKLARPFGASLQILEGYGFFGSEVCPEPAAARYTSVKLSKESSDILKKYKYLDTREAEGAYDPFWMDLPLGLTTSIVGISVGYKTTILPRKLSDIKDYLEGKIKKVLPHFKDFKGTIKKHHNLGNAWIISSKITISEKRIEIREMPPILNYSSVLKRLDYLFNRYDGLVKVLNNSNKKVDIDIIYTGKNENEWKDIQAYVQKSFSVIVTENPVFIKDGQVLVYDSVEQYLEDYKWQVKRLDWKNKEWQRNWLSREITFNKAKVELINFILAKKRSVDEIDKFLEPFDNDLKSRLESLTSKKFTEDELKATKEKIKELEKDLKIKDKEFIEAKSVFEGLKDPTIERGIGSKKNQSNLFDTEDLEEVDGILIWNGEDPFDNEKKEEGEE